MAVVRPAGGPAPRPRQHVRDGAPEGASSPPPAPAGLSTGRPLVWEQPVPASSLERNLELEDVGRGESAAIRRGPHPRADVVEVDLRVVSLDVVVDAEGVERLVESVALDGEFDMLMSLIWKGVSLNGMVW